MEIFSNTVEETEHLGAALAEHLLNSGRFPAFVALYGDLAPARLPLSADLPVSSLPEVG